jgi:hypothetical protein
MELSLKFDLRAPAWGTSAADLDAAALDMAEWADRTGFHSIRLLERRAARVADAFDPIDPALYAEYLAECARLDIEAGPEPSRAPTRVVIPEELLVVGREPVECGRLAFHPLVGGADLEIGRSCVLRLFERDVLPVLRFERLVSG